MSTDPRVSELFARYRQLRAQGQAPRPEELCKTCPELLPELLQLLAGPGDTDQTLGTILPPAPNTPRLSSKPRSGASVAPPRPEVPGYELLEELGRGGMGIVYRAREIKGDRIVALKMVLAGGHANEADLARFRIEADAVCRLQHPSIVQIHDVGEHNGLPYLALEYCGGGSLADLLTGTPLTHERAARVMEALAGAIQAAHKQGIVHRDLKPANVLLTEDGQPRLTDFGLAKLLDATTVYTQTGAVLGTPSYMSPEQAAGRTHDIGPATDVYGLGAILYEMLTGRPPFRAATSLETMEQVKSQEPAAPRLLQPRTPRDLETICLKCLQKEPGKRYASGAELASDLGRFLAGQPVQARPIGTRERLWRWCRRNPVVAGLTAAIAALLVVVAVGATITAAAYKATAVREREQHQRMLTLEIQTLLLQGNHHEALARADLHRDDLPEDGKEVTGRIRTAWRDAARKEVGSKNFAGALATARALLARFPDDTDTVALRREAFHGVLLVEVTTLLQHQEHPRALEVVRKNGAELPQQGRALEKVVRDDWLRKARRELADKQYKTAGDTARLMLAAFGEDHEVRGIAQQATHAVVKAKANRLMETGKFSEAVEAVDGRRVELPQGGSDLKEEVRGAWLARAEAAAAQERFDDAVKMCDDLLRFFKEDADAQRRRAVYSGKVALLQNEKARAVLARAKELEEAAHRLRRAEDPARPFQAADADKAYRDLKEASALWEQAQQQPPLSLRVELALAAHHKSVPDAPLFQKLASTLLTGEDAARLGPDAYPLLLARAKSQDDSPSGRQAALAAYAELLGRAYKRSTQQTAPFDVYAALQAIAAALEGAGNGDVESNKLLARCYAAQARLLREPAGAKLPGADPRRQAFELFSKAVTLDPENAEYLIGKSYSRTGLPNPDWKELEGNARRAVEIAPRAPAGQGLLGYVWLMQARLEPDYRARLRKYSQALEAFQQAMNYSDQNEEGWPTLLLNRSMTSLELGTNLAPEDREGARKHLEDARTHAERATRLKHPNPEYVHETLGNALEDLALWLGETDRYAEAILEFGKAVELKAERISPWLGRARCRYRLAATGKGDRSILPEALSDLKTIIERRPPNNQLAEARYWQGMVYQLLGSAEEAHRAFAQAAAVGDKIAASGWALEADADLCLREAAVHLGQDHAQAALERVAAARKAADRLKDQGAPKAAAVLARVHKVRAEILLAQADALLSQNAADDKGQVYLAEAGQLAEDLEAQNEVMAAASIRGQVHAIGGNPEKAIQAFSKPLPADPSRAAAVHAALLVARTGYFLSNRCPAALRPAPEALIADADRAAAVAPGLTLKADALALAGAARGVAALGFVDQPAKQHQFREQAADNLRKAINIAPDHPDNWAFRWRLAKELHSLTAGAANAGRREAIRDEAARELTRSLEHAPARYRDELLRFQAVLDEGKNGG